MKKWKKLIHGMVTIPLLLGCVSLSAVPKHVLVFGSNPAASGDEYHSCFFEGALNTHPEALYDAVDLVIQIGQDEWRRAIEFISGDPGSSKEDLDEALSQQKKNDDLAQKLNAARSKGAGIEDIKAIIAKEASPCGIGEDLSLLLGGLEPGPNAENTRRKLREQGHRCRYTFVSSPYPQNHLLSALYKFSPYPVDYIPCTVGTGQFLKLVQERGEGFDYIYPCSATLYGDSLPVIEELINVLNPGGKLYICSEDDEYDYLAEHYLRLHGLTETHLDDKKATIREADYYTLTPPEREELDNVVLWNPRVEGKDLWERKPVPPSPIKHHFQGKSNEYMDQTSKPLLIVTKDK
ncbi:MAG: hypothetical protein LBR62_03130 [Puniceicoccales bacterium]|jgi:hypothetical protein|nr:hypothetical protein [Puniceicoccales bacterium]